MVKHKREFSILVIFVAALLAVIFACAFNDVGYDGIAKADGELSFTIATADGYNWKLLFDGESVAEFNGEWADPPQSDVASVVFESKIKSLLAEHGKTAYSLEFDLPEVGYTVLGSTEFDYTENGDICVILRGVYSPIISGDITDSLQFKSGDGEYLTYDADERNDGLAFGRGVDVGKYRVRYAVFERFIYDGKEYRVGRYSVPIDCTVNAAQVQAPDVDCVSVEYGTAARDIAKGIVAGDGIWALSAEQNSDNYVGDDTVLGVKDGVYSLKFDYIPNNKNYKVVEGVEIDVTVTPRALRIYIENAYSVVGEPLAENIGYEVTTELIGEDSVEDLGVEIYVVGTDGSVAGQYSILARFSNVNYVPDCKNYGNPLIIGGVYTVYENTLTAIAPDGVEFTVYIRGGFENLALRVELADKSILPDFIKVGTDKYRVTAGYVLVFENADGERVFPEGEFLLRLSDVSGATHYHSEDGLNEIDGNGMLMSSFVIELCVKVVQISADDILISQINLALGIISCVLAVVFIALVAVYAKGGRK